MLLCICSVTDHRRHQNVVTTLETQSACVPLFCSYHILTSSVIYTATWNLFVVYILLAQSTKGLGSFVNILRSRFPPAERLGDVSASASTSKLASFGFYNIPQGLRSSFSNRIGAFNLLVLALKVTFSVLVARNCCIRVKSCNTNFPSCG